MLRYGEQYVDKGMKYYEEKYREHEIRSIQKKAKSISYNTDPKENRSVRASSSLPLACPTLALHAKASA